MSNAALTPAAVTAPVSNAAWKVGTRNAELGNGPVIIDQQQAGITIIVRGPNASSA